MRRIQRIIGGLLVFCHIFSLLPVLTFAEEASFEEVEETVYAVSETEVRTGPDTAYMIMARLRTGDSITRTGIDKEWSRVDYNGQDGYVLNEYLSLTKAADTTETASGVCGDNLTWELDEDGCLTVSGTGDMEDYCGSWSEYRSQICAVVIEDGVTSIGESAFSWCENIESVQIAGSVKQIGNSAFSDCESLTELQISDGVESIGVEAFGGCDSLIFAEIPASVTDLNLYAFAYCDSLKAFAVAEKNLVYANDEAGILYNKDMTALIKCPAGYEGVYTVPDGTESIGTWSFSACGRLTGVLIPDSVTEIGSYAFETCESLMEVRLSEEITSIPEGTFLSSESLTHLTIPKSVMEIGEMAFGHSGLTEVVFQGNAPIMNDYAFAYVTATAQYPCEDETWTENARQNYGGELTWKPYVLEAHVHTYTAVVTAPTCTAKGYTTHTCECDDSYVDSYVDATGHTMSEWYETKAPTQEAEGEECRDCQYCDYYETNVLDKLENPDEVLQEVNETVYPICSLKGGYLHVREKPDASSSSIGRLNVGESVTRTGINAAGWSRIIFNGIDGYVWSEYLSTQKHSYQATVTPPKCIEQGYTTHTCECGDSYVDSYVDATGHTMGEWEIIDEGSCMQDGTERRDCLACDHYETRTVSATGHSYSFVVTAPTCTEQGYTTHTCECGDSYVDSYIAAAGHTMGEWITVNDATCIDAGLERRDCTVCDHYETREIAAKGHAYVENTTAPTCTEPGYTTYTCDCGRSYVDDLVQALGHTMGDWVTINAATCLNDGTERSDCTVCDHYETRIVSATGHKYSVAVIAPTCTEQGYTTHICACGNSYIDSYTPAKGHAMGEWYETVAPEVYKVGEERRDCENCDYYETQENYIGGVCGDNLTWTLFEGILTISGRGEMYECADEWVVDYPWVRAYGNEIKQVVIEPGVTSICEFAFWSCRNLYSVQIPSSVTNIGESAFDLCTSLTEIAVNEANSIYSSDSNGVLFNKDKTILICCPSGKTGAYTVPDSVIIIGEYAFYHCDRLNSVVIPDSVTSIRAGAFSECFRLTSVEIPEGVTSIEEYVFSLCTSLTSITISDSITSIGDEAFYDCYNLVSVTIGNSVTSIGDWAFYWCGSLTSVTIPATVISIGENAFGSCSSLMEIVVDEENPAYSSDPYGVLFNNDKTMLIRCPGGREGTYTVPDSVTTIEDYAFASCYRLTSVTIPDSVTSIGLGVFSGCNSLTSVIIPDCVTSIEFCAFDDCDSLADVYFSGSEEEWKEITIDSGNENLSNATIHCNSTGPDSDGDDALATTYVRYFREWDEEKQIAYFDGEKSFGYQVREETDLSFLENVDSLVGQYVLVESRAWNYESTIMDTLLSIKTVESKIGTVNAADDDARTITIDGITYDVTMSRIIESANGNDPTEIIAPSTYVDEFVLYHIYEDKVAGIEILKTLQGSLTGWNKETRHLSISKDDLTADSDWVSGSYMLSSFADEDTEALLNSLSSGDTTIVTKIQFVCDGQRVVYSIMVINTPPESNEPVITGFASEVDGWSVINVRNSFGYAEDYHIPFSTYYVNGFSFSAAIKSIFNRRWGGSCFGLSLLAIAEYNGQGSLQEYFDREGDSLNEFGYQSVIDATYTSQTGNTFSGQIYTLAGNEEIIQTIERAQVSQCSSQIANAEVFKWDSDYSELLKYLSQDNPAPLIVTMVLGNSGHAVAIDTSEKPIDLGGGIYALMCYDSNSPQLTNKLDNGWTVYDYDQTFITLDTTNGHWCYYYNGETDGYRNYNFLQTRNIRFYDVTKLTSEFFYGKYSLDEDNVTNFFEASNLTVEANDSDDVLFEVSNSNPVLYALNAEYYPYCESVFSDSQNAKGYIMAPDGEYCFINEDDASVVRISDSYIVAYEVDTDATVYFNDESTTFTIGNESDSTILNFKCAIQNVDGNVVVSAEGMLDNLSSITISADLDEQTATATTNSNLEAIDTLLEVGGEPQSQDFHVEDTSNEEHSYGTPEFVWEEDYTCTANFRCGHCANVQTTNCIVTSNSTAATETQAGKTVYTATVEFDDLTYTDTKTVTIPATGHVTHTAATEWISDGTNHWHKCTGCDEKLDVATHSGGTATCTKKAVCAVCGVSYGELASHDYKAAWAQGDSNGHWHECKNCSAHDTQIKHTPGAAATETKAQTCIVCGYVVTPALGHTCTAGSKWYSNGTYHWHLCTSCGAWVKTSYHSYSSDMDETCNVCGYVRTVMETEPTEETEAAVTEATKATVPAEEVIATETDSTTVATEGNEILTGDDVSEGTDSSGIGGVLITALVIVALGSLVALIILMVYKKRKENE